MFGENLKQARNERGYTQQQFADMIHDHRVNVAHYERGVKIPSVAVVLRIADTLNVSLDWLFDRKE